MAGLEGPGAIVKGPPSRVWRFTLPPWQPGNRPCYPVVASKPFLLEMALTPDFPTTERGIPAPPTLLALPPSTASVRYVR